MRRSSFALAALVLACVDPNARTSIDGPDRSQFDLVQPFLENSCGTLDCHGTRYRNLKVWGYEGLRLAPGDIPGGNPTTTAEVDATYESIVSLEPEIMNEVVAQQGADPERLTIVRKARGTESHAGGAVLTVGGNGDRCFTSWLARSLDDGACHLAQSSP
ncbi:MAG TPA: hypothetical protein VH054_12690 [Polyangiaceae bacterium]|jgi:hypothetical protein|nr:hypothetical protein [Polyangiaceae bacterium]